MDRKPTQKAGKRSPSESAIQKAILDYLKSRGAWAIKVIVANEAGCPDILCCYRGRFVGIEAKKPGGNITKIQEVQLTRIIDAEGHGIIVRSVDGVKFVLDGIDMMLKQTGTRNNENHTTKPRL